MFAVAGVAPQLIRLCHTGADTAVWATNMAVSELILLKDATMSKLVQHDCAILPRVEASVILVMATGAPQLTLLCNTVEDTAVFPSQSLPIIDTAVS